MHSFCLVNAGIKGLSHHALNGYFFLFLFLRQWWNLRPPVCRWVFYYWDECWAESSFKYRHVYTTVFLRVIHYIQQHVLISEYNLFWEASICLTTHQSRHKISHSPQPLHCLSSQDESQLPPLAQVSLLPAPVELSGSPEGGTCVSSLQLCIDCLISSCCCMYWVAFYVWTWAVCPVSSRHAWGYF